MWYSAIGVIVTLTLSLAVPLAAAAQPPGKVYRIGYLGTNPPPADWWDALLDGLRERGYSEGRNLVFERRFSEGNAKRFPELAAAMARQSTEDLTWMEVRDAIAAGRTTAIYYAASTEQNGPGLALGKHIFIAHYAAQRKAEELGNALVYPTMPYAIAGDPIKKTGHMAFFQGTVSLSEETFGAVARDVALSAIAAGFKNVALMGDHGGGQQTLR